MTSTRCDAVLGDASTYEFLVGRWRIDRTYVEHRRNERGTFSGTVVVAPPWGGDPAAARYAEEGHFVLGGYRGAGRRRLGMIRRPSGAVSLRFEDGRPFVDCDLEAGRCRAIHRCGDDRYEISWRVVSHDVMTERWRVLGPHKDYAAWAVLRRTRSRSYVA